MSSLPNIREGADVWGTFPGLMVRVTGAGNGSSVRINLHLKGARYRAGFIRKHRVCMTVAHIGGRLFSRKVHCHAAGCASPHGSMAVRHISG